MRSATTPAPALNYSLDPERGIVENPLANEHFSSNPMVGLMHRTVISFAFLGTLLLAASGCQQLGASAGPCLEAAVADGAASARQDRPSKILVAYYSLSGNTEKMARAVEEGAREVAGVTVLTKPVTEVAKTDLDSAHGVILGCAAHYANIPAAMKAAIDQWAWKERVNLTDKVGGAFSTGGNLTGGKEHVVISLLLYMLNNRMIVVGPICKEGDGGWGEIGASATTGHDDPGLSEAELTAARRLGRRVARVLGSRRSGSASPGR